MICIHLWNLIPEVNETLCLYATNPVDADLCNHWKNTHGNTEFGHVTWATFIFPLKDRGVDDLHMHSQMRLRVKQTDPTTYCPHASQSRHQSIIVVRCEGKGNLPLLSSPPGSKLSEVTSRRRSISRIRDYQFPFFAFIRGDTRQHFTSPLPLYVGECVNTLGSGYIVCIGTRQKLMINPKCWYFRNNLLLFGTV